MVNSYVRNGSEKLFFWQNLAKSLHNKKKSPFLVIVPTLGSPFGRCQLNVFTLTRRVI